MMRKFWFYFKAFWHGFFHRLDSQEQREEYANKEAWEYMRRIGVK